MKYLIVIFSFLTLSLSAQRLGGFSIAVFANPESLPATLSNTDNSVSRMAYVKSEGKFYRWDVTNTSTNVGSWSHFTQVDRISAGSPSYTPTLGDSPIAINGSGTIYTWNGSSWNIISGGGGATNLTFSRDGNTVTVISDTGTDAILPFATQTLAGVLKSTDKILIDSALQTISHDATLIGTGRTGSILQVDTATKIATIYDVSRVDDDFLNSEMNGLTVGNTSTQNAIALNLLLPNRKYIFVPKNVVVDYNQVNLTTVGNRGTHIFDENYGGWIANGGIFKISDNGSTPTFLLSGLRSTDEFNFYLQPGLKYGGTVRSKIDLFADPFIDVLTGINNQDYGTAGILIQEPYTTVTTTNPDGSVYPPNVKSPSRYASTWMFDLNTKINGTAKQFGYTPPIRLTTQDGSFAPLEVYQYKYDGMPTLKKGGHYWRPNILVTIGDYVTYNWNVSGSVYAQGIFRAESTGTTGNTPPTHTTGVASDGNINWTFIDDTYSGANQSAIVVLNGSLQPGDTDVKADSLFKLPVNSKEFSLYSHGSFAFSDITDNTGLYWWKEGFRNTYAQPNFATGLKAGIWIDKNSSSNNNGANFYISNNWGASNQYIRMNNTDVNSFIQFNGTAFLLPSFSSSSPTTTLNVNSSVIYRLNYGTATTITDITQTANGAQEIYISSTNTNITLANNSRIKLAKGANTVLIPNTHYHFIYNNSDAIWQEVTNTLSSAAQNLGDTDGDGTANVNYLYEGLGTKSVQLNNLSEFAVDSPNTISLASGSLNLTMDSGDDNIVIDGNAQIQLSASEILLSSSAVTPTITMRNTTNLNDISLTTGAPTSSYKFVLPNTPPTLNQVLTVTNVAGPIITLSGVTPSGGGGSSVTTTREDGVITSTSSTTWNPLTASTDRMLDATVNNGFTYTVNLGQASNCQNCEISFSNWNAGITGTGVMFIDGFGSELVGSGGTFTIGAGLGASFKSVNTSGATWEWRRKF